MNTKEFRPLYLDFQFVMTLNTDREHTFKSQVFTPYLNFKSIVTIAVQPRKADSGSLGTLLWPRSQGEDEALDLRRPWSQSPLLRSTLFDSPLESQGASQCLPHGRALQGSAAEGLTWLCAEIPREKLLDHKAHENNQEQELTPKRQNRAALTNSFL